jgi:hypothetical protein
MQRSASKIFLGASALQAFITASVAVIVFAGLENFKKTQTNKAH